ncbi:MAG: methyltransferase domain-containing protein, partial [Bacteroidota bacterium]
GLISLWHVLEHVHRLSETLQKLKRMLDSGGKLLIAVPNHQSWEAGLYREYWAGYDVPRHLYHFSPDTMQRLLEKNGLGIQEKIPMIFDAFYVSLLSGKYKSGYMNFPLAFGRGLWSNLKARGDGNYSSLIYVVGLLE